MPTNEKYERDLANIQKYKELVSTGTPKGEAARLCGYTGHGMRFLLKRYPELTVTKQTFDKNDQLISTVQSIRENTDVDTTGMRIKGITTSPYGGAFVKYDNEEDIRQAADDVLESVREHFKTVKPIKLSKPKKTGKHLKIYTADKHVGCGGFKRRNKENIYNKSVYKARMNKLLAEVVYLKHYYGEFESVTYFDLGDNLDGYNGQTTRGGHRLPQNMGDREQYDTFCEVESSVIDTLVKEFGTINYVAQSVDNHAGAFGYTAYKTVEMYINAKYPDCTTLVADEFIQHIAIGGETILFCHGKDDKNMKYGMPLYPKSQTTEKVREYMDDYRILDKVKFVKGDLHQFNFCTAKKYDYINVPSIMGSSEWIYDNFGNTPAGAYIEVNDTQMPIWF